MSEFTFNIADYHPLSAVRVHRLHDPGPMVKRSNGFVVLTSNSEPREYGAPWLEARPSVVDIRSVREAHRTAHPSYPRRGKILRFTSEPFQVCTMPRDAQGPQLDDDPDPIAA